MIPPAKFESVPEKAIPTAIPAAPSKVKKEVISTPNWVIAVMDTMILRAMDKKLVRNEMSPGSVSLLRKMRLTKRVKTPVSQKPKTAMTMASTKLVSKPKITLLKSPVLRSKSVSIKCMS